MRNKSWYGNEVVTYVSPPDAAHALGAKNIGYHVHSSCHQALLQRTAEYVADGIKQVRLSIFGMELLQEQRERSVREVTANAAG